MCGQCVSWLVLCESSLYLLIEALTPSPVYIATGYHTAYYSNNKKPVDCIYGVNRTNNSTLRIKDEMDNMKTFHSKDMTYFYVAKRFMAKMVFALFPAFSASFGLLF